MGYGNSSIRRRSNRLDGEASGGASVDAAALECSLDELREFLEADLVDVPVDLEFKECLRSRLWDLVQARNRMRASRARRS
jgi:hypothetical protein